MSLHQINMTEVSESIQIQFRSTVHIRKKLHFSLPKIVIIVCSSYRVESDECGMTQSENSLSPLSSQEISTAHQPSTKVSHTPSIDFMGNFFLLQITDQERVLYTWTFLCLIIFLWVDDNLVFHLHNFFTQITHFGSSALMNSYFQMYIICDPGPQNHVAYKYTVMVTIIDFSFLPKIFRI